MNAKNFKIETEETVACNKKVSVTVPATEIKAAFKTTIAQFNGHVSVPGFRQGLAPKGLIMKKYGKDVLEQVRQDIIRTTFQSLLEDKALTPLTSPDIQDGELKDGAEFTFTMTYDVKPSFEIPSTESFEFSKTKYVRDQEEIDKAILELRERMARLDKVERPVQEEDFVKCSYEASLTSGEEVPEDAQALLGGEDRWVTIKDDSQLPAVVENLVGKEAGESIEWTATYGEDFAFNDFLKNKEIKVNLTITEVQSKVAPELDEEFAKQVGADSVEKLTELLEQNIESQFETAEKNKLKEQALELILKDFDCALPPTVLKNTIDRNIHQLQHEGHDHNQGEACDHADAEITDEQKEKAEADANKELKTRFLLTAIAEEASLEVSDMELYQYVAQLAQMYRSEVSDLYKRFQENGYIEEIKEQLLSEKALESIIDKSTVTEVEPTAAN